MRFSSTFVNATNPLKSCSLKLFAAVGDVNDLTIYDRWRQQRSVIDVFSVYDRDR